MNGAVKSTLLASLFSMDQRDGQLAALRLQIFHLKAKYRNLERSRNYCLRRNEILERILECENPHLHVPGGPTAQEIFLVSYLNRRRSLAQAPAQDEDFAHLLVHESQCNSIRSPPGRRWSLFVVQFCFLLRTLGSKSYDYLRSVLTLPSKSTFTRYFEAGFAQWKQSLIDAEMVGRICNLFRQINHLDDTVEVEIGLGIDAMAMEPVTEDADGAAIGSNNAFLFQLMPLQCEFRSIPLHLMTKNKGNAGTDVLTKIDFLKRRLRELKFNVNFVAVDGDAGYACLHQQMFTTWWSLYCSEGLDAAVRNLDTDCCIVTDLLHVAKNARSRLIGGRLTMCCDGSHSFTGEMMNRILKLGPALSDKSMHGKMRDIYALQIFNLDNFLTLAAKQRWVMAFYILPYALWIEAIRNPGLSVQMRRDFINLAFEIFVYHLKIIHSLERSSVSQNKKGDMTQYCCSEIQCIRILNTLLITLLQLTTHPDNLALSRIGTHGLECQFGIIRVMCRNKHTWKMILRSFSRLMMIKELMKTFGPLDLRNRVNTAGVKVHLSDSRQSIYVPMPEVDVRNLYEWIHFKEFNGNIEEEEEEEEETCEDVGCDEVLAEARHGLSSFVDYVNNLIERCDEDNVTNARLWMGSPVSNNGILARLVCFRTSDGGENQETTETVIEGSEAEDLVNMISP